MIDNFTLFHLKFLDGVSASNALTELRRLFREYDSGKMSESDYVASAKHLEAVEFEGRWVGSIPR